MGDHLLWHARGKSHSCKVATEGGRQQQRGWRSTTDSCMVRIKCSGRLCSPATRASFVIGITPPGAISILVSGRCDDDR